jgi:hypothetical protein
VLEQIVAVYESKNVYSTESLLSWSPDVERCHYLCESSVCVWLPPPLVSRHHVSVHVVFPDAQIVVGRDQQVSVGAEKRNANERLLEGFEVASRDSNRDAMNEIFFFGAVKGVVKRRRHFLVTWSCERVLP